MAQRLIQTQEQKLAQQQKLTQQQMLAVRLMEMPVTELEQNVAAELDDNPALESGGQDGEAEPEYDGDEARRRRAARPRVNMGTSTTATRRRSTTRSGSR